MVQEISFATRDIPPPAPLYVTNADKIFITTYNSLSGVEVVVMGRIIDPAGKVLPFNVFHTPKSDRTPTSTIQMLKEGYLISVSVANSAGTPRRGHTWVQVGILWGAGGQHTEYVTLIEDYIADFDYAFWPWGKVSHFPDGPGLIRSITGTNPAAGSELSETVPTNARWRLISFYASFVTDSTVASRRPTLIIDDGTNTVFRAVTTATQGASLTGHWSWAATGCELTATVEGVVVPIPHNLFLMGGYRIKTDTDAMAAGDNWGAPQILVEEWIEP